MFLEIPADRPKGQTEIVSGGSGVDTLILSQPEGNGLIISSVEFTIIGGDTFNPMNGANAAAGDSGDESVTG